ncbi:MAG TPA: CARDB domain-containing protein [Solirubrobacter sp.]|nr:CARDB domain-containing protein [Solirubrobacter sp.]
MFRWLVGVALAAVFVSDAQAASPWAKANLTRCDREANEAVFAGRITAYRRAAKMQMRFTLQARTPEVRRWHRVDAPGFGTWITVPAGFARYTYEKTVQELLAPASYRAVVQFRWRDARGKVIRSERLRSGTCRQRDMRPDLVLLEVKADPDGYVAVVFNRGREAADAFDVRFMADGVLLGSTRVSRLEPRSAIDVFLPGQRCAPGTPLEAVVDPLSEVDEANEFNDSVSAFC